MPRYSVPIAWVQHYRATVEVEADDPTEAAEEALKLAADAEFLERFTDTLVVMEKIKELDAPPSTAHH